MKQETLEVIVLHQDGVDVYREGLRAILHRLHREQAIPADVSKSEHKEIVAVSLTTEMTTVGEYNLSVGEVSPEGLMMWAAARGIRGYDSKHPITVFRVLCDVPE